jgi:hypothetical protein
MCVAPVLSGGRSGWHLEVLVAAGLGLFGTVIWASREAV